MAILKDNHLLAGLSGKLGDYVLRQLNGKTILSAVPKKKNRKISDRQAKQQKRFKEAVAYAKRILNDPEQKKMYGGKLKKGQTVFQYALKEFMDVNK